MGGVIVTPNGSQYSSVKAYDVNTAVQSSWNPPNLGTAYAIEANNQYVFVGGSLNEPSGGAGRQNLFAIDRTTGALSSWAPNPSDGIKSLFLSNDQLYVGGYFTIISGQTRNRVASYNTSTLGLTNWNPNSNSYVNTINLKNGSIWLGGHFSNVGGTSKNLLAGVDPISAAINFNSNTSFNSIDEINAINSKGCKMFLGGNFQVNSCSMLSVFDIGANVLLPTSSFCLVINGYRISTLVIIGNDLYFGGRFDKINSNTKSTNIGKLSFPANYFTPCTIANCGNAFTLSSTVDDYSTGTYNQKSSLGITATNKVTGNSQVTLKSNSSILLLPLATKGFVALPSSGGYFKAEIGGCN